MNLIVHPGAKLSGDILLPGDKSISHRAALLAAMADGESRIERFLVSGVTRAMLDALTGLGVGWELEGDTLRVAGTGAFSVPQKALDCGNSATTMRLLAGAIAARGIPAMLDGSPGLRRRPMERIIEPLRAMGVSVAAHATGGAPLAFGRRDSGRRLKAIDHHLPVASAQVKSCLLLAGLAADGAFIISEPALSRDHSERMLRSLGVEIQPLRLEDRPAVRITPPGILQFPPLTMTIPGDFSAAAFLLVAALVARGSHITLRGVNLNPTRAGLLDTLQEMGAGIVLDNLRQQGGEPIGDLVVRAAELHGVAVSGDRVVQMIDEFPVFAVAAAYAHGRSVVTQAGELRYKESDRITALCERLRALGVQVQELPDGFIIDGCGAVPGGGCLDAHGDHRLAMAMAVAGLGASRPVEIEGAEILAESFPQFPAILRELGAALVEREEHA
ncbi:MAG: 3-phosphoshikimate 1-carboxyvinyltransferase [Anaerolineaceae bacterium]